jgi:hypothetical protein
MNLKLTQLLNEYAQKVVNDLIKKYMVENPNLTDDDIETIKKDYINRFEELKSSPKVDEKDITKYSFQQLKKLVDSFPKKEKSSNNNVEFSQTELIYNKAPLQIYHGSNERTCIKIKGDFAATWCISRSGGGNMYNGYRYAGTEPSFYFVKNLERLNKITEINDDKYCFFVIQFNNQGKYIVTNAKNDGDRRMTWEEILEIEPLLQGTESLFKNVPLTDEEKEYYRRFKDGIEDGEYKDLSYKEKKIYIAITHELNDVKFKNTPNDLLNDYISMGVELTEEQFNFIKDTRQLFNNYRRVTIDNIIPEYLKDNINFDNRWLVLTNDEAIDLYEKKSENLTQILYYKPQLVDYFKDELYKLRGYSIMQLLEKYPQLIDKFQDFLNKLSTSQISTVLIEQPQLIGKFEYRLIDLDRDDISLILSIRPQLLGKFEDRLNRLSDDNIRDVLSNQPQLIGKFENELNKLDYKHINYILSKQPQLEPYFKKKGLLKESLKYPPLRNILKR